MTEHSPTPWRVVYGPARGLVILDAGGEAVAATLDPSRRRSEADANLIVEAVNGFADAALGKRPGTSSPPGGGAAARPSRTAPIRGASTLEKQAGGRFQDKPAKPTEDGQ